MMRPIFLFLILCSTVTGSFATSHGRHLLRNQWSPSKTDSVPPAYLIQSHSAEYLLKQDASTPQALDNMNPDWIAGITILKPNPASKKNKYPGGAIIIELNDEKHPEAFKALRPSLIFADSVKTKNSTPDH